MGHKFIKEIAAGETIDDVYVVIDPILRSTTRGDLYIAMFLSDSTGRLNGRMWQATEGIYKRLPKPGFVHIKGRSEIYQNNLQIVVNNVEPVEADKVNPADFLAKTSKDVKAMFVEIREIPGQIKNAQIKKLAEAYLADKELMKSFCKAPGGVKLHHNFLGGLLEHTHTMLKVAQAVLPFYPQVNADLVLAGILVHDMGKTEELGYDMAFTYTDSGQLIGHVSKSYLMLNRKADALAQGGEPIDEEIIDALGHIILSHHGEYEYGSPKLPATTEAFMVNYIDNLDAKICQVTQMIDNELGDSNWTAWQSALQTRLYRKKI